MTKSYRDLRVWQESVDLVEAIYTTTGAFPPDERFHLIAQMRAAAISIPSNMAEGQGRITSGEWLQFLGHARGSLFELETQLTISERLKMLAPEDLQQLLLRTASIRGGLAGLMNYLRTTAPRRRP